MTEQNEEELGFFSRHVATIFALGTIGVFTSYLALDPRLAERPTLEKLPSFVTPNSYEITNTQPLIITNDSLPEIDEPSPAVRVGVVPNSQP
jgi:hypothetical protein